MEKVNIGFIGAGNMGTAIMKGISANVKNVQLYAFDPKSENVEKLAECGVKPCQSEAELTKKCKYVFLAVKPQIIEGVLEKCAVSADSEKVFVSLCFHYVETF